MSKKPDVEMLEFMAALERGVQEAIRGEGRVTTPEQIKARSAGGRPVQTVHKQPVTLRLDPKALEIWRASGKGWQTRAAALLAQHAPVSA